MSSGKFLSKDGLSISYSVDPAPGDSRRAVVVVVHGLGDHSRSVPYELLTSFLNKNGYPVFRYDLRGYGSSDGIRGHIDAFDQHQADLKAAVKEAMYVTSCSGVYILACSMGGLIAIDYAIQDPVNIGGVVAIAPALSSSGAPKPLRALVPFLSRILPKQTIDPGLDLTSISRDKEAAERYTTDPLFSTRLTLRAASEVLKAVDRVNKNAEKLSIPFLILHGSSDTIVPPGASESFLDSIITLRKKRILYPEARHNLLIETNRDEVLSNILQWINEVEEARLPTT